MGRLCDGGYEKEDKYMKKDWENVTLMPEFDEQGVACYRLDGGDYLNEYYVVSEAETRKLLNTPEIVCLHTPRADCNGRNAQNCNMHFSERVLSR